MNPENKDPRITKTNHPSIEPAAFSCERDGIAATSRIRRRLQAESVILLGIRRPMFFISGLALCMGLASCIIPYDSHEGGSVSVTRYSPGYRVASLPGGYRSENISGSTYYYNDGYYYQPRSGGYVIVDAPRTSRYYDDYSRRQRTYQTSTTYQESPNRHDGRYERGEVLTRLPDGYREVNHRGATYYQAGDRYYRRQGETYVVTTRPY